MRVFLAAAGVALATAVSKQAPGAGDAISGTSAQVLGLIDLLKSLEKDMTAEFGEAEEAYDKKAVSHAATIKGSKKTIKETSDRIETLTDSIKKNHGDIAALKADISGHAGRIAKKKDEIEKAIAQRQEEHGEFAATVEEFEAAIKSAHIAYTVLSDQDSGSQKSTEVNRSPESLLSIARSSGKTAQAIWKKVAKDIALVPVPKRVTSDRVEELQEFAEAMADPESASSQGSSLLQTAFSGASQRIMGILKDMRGEYIAKLQGAQEAEHESTVTHVSFIKRARKMLSNLEKSKADREATLADTESDMETNEQEKESKQAERDEAQALLEETTQAARDLAKAWAETSRQHTKEMFGLDTAVNFLSGQQDVGKKAANNEYAKGGLIQRETMALLQLNANEQPLYQNQFQKIVWAIEDMVEEHQSTKQENTAKKTMCQQASAQANSAAAKKKAAIDTINAHIADAKAQKKQANSDKDEAEKEKTDTEKERDDAQEAWTKSDSSRHNEITGMDKSIELISGAVKALRDAGGDAFTDTISILEMIRGDCESSADGLKAARQAEETEWGKQKKTFHDMIAGLASQIADLNAKITQLDKKLGVLDGKLLSTKAIEPMNQDECETFIAAFQGKQDKLTKKVEDLQSAKGFLAGWKNQSSTQHDGAATFSAHELPTLLQKLSQLGIA